MAPVLLALGLNVAAFFYFHAWRPLLDFYKWIRLSRQIKAMRIAGLLLILCALGAPARAQKVDPQQLKKYEAMTERLRTEEREMIFKQQLAERYSDGDDALVAKYQLTKEGITGWAPLDNALLWVFNNCGTLLIFFALLAAISILRHKVNSAECYGDVLRREAAVRWEEEQGDDSIHNPFDSPEGMQPTTQYVPVRTKR